MLIINKEILAGNTYLVGPLNIENISKDNFRQIINRIDLVYGLCEFQVCEGRHLDINEFNEIEKMLDFSRSEKMLDKEMHDKICHWINILNNRVVVRGESIIFKYCPHEMKSVQKGDTQESVPRHQ